MSATVLALVAFAFQVPEGHAVLPPSGPAGVPLGPEDLSERERALWRAFAGPLTALPSPTNALADDPRAAALGQALFFDPGLSRDGRFSCVSCHDPSLGWADGRALSLGREPLTRNTPSVVGAALQAWQFWDGRADSLWAQALEPIEAPLEMDGSRMELAHHLTADEGLRVLYEELFGPLPDLSDRARFPARARPAPVRPADPFGGPSPEQLTDPAVAAWAGMAPEDQALVSAIFARVGKSLEAFERRLLPAPAPFDSFAAGLEQADPQGLDAVPVAALHGWRLFTSSAGCIACHFGPNFSDGRFHNLGLPVPAGESAEEGRPAGVRRVRVDPMNGRGVHSDASDWSANQKLLFMVSNEHVLGAFKTPSLRNLLHTAPYGHDGRFPELADVLDFYSELPEESVLGHREETLQPLGLSQAERAALLAFLATLSGAPVGVDGAPLPVADEGED